MSTDYRIVPRVKRYVDYQCFVHRLEENVSATYSVFKLLTRDPLIYHDEIVYTYWSHVLDFPNVKEAQDYVSKCKSLIK